MTAPTIQVSFDPPLTPAISRALVAKVADMLGQILADWDERHKGDEEQDFVQEEVQGA